MACNYYHEMICELPARGSHDEPYESRLQKEQHDFCIQEIERSLAEGSGRSTMDLTSKELDC